MNDLFAYTFYGMLALLVLSWGFPYYIAVSSAWREGKLSKIDMYIHAVPVFFFGLLDVAFNIIFASFIFWDWPFLHGYTLSQRSCYWIHQLDDDWRWGCAHAVKVQTDKYKEGHIS